MISLASITSFLGLFVPCPHAPDLLAQGIIERSVLIPAQNFPDSNVFSFSEHTTVKSFNKMAEEETAEAKVWTGYDVKAVYKCGKRQVPVW